MKSTLLQAANANLKSQENTSSNIAKQFTIIAESINQSPNLVFENVTHLLANIANTVLNGKPIKLLHLNSVAAFLAGVEAIAKALPVTSDEMKKQNTLRVLATAGLDDSGQINDSTFPIVNIGAKKQDLQSKYADMIKKYASSLTLGQPDGQQLGQAVKQLQFFIDKAMRVATVPTPPPTIA
jgi:hypothetical protein